MSESETPNAATKNWWKRIALVAILAGAPAWVLAVVQLWGAATKQTGPELVVSTKSNDVRLPQSMWDDVELLEDIADVAERRLPKDELTEVLEGKPIPSPRFEYNSLSSHVFVSIHNSGVVNASDVRLKVNFSGIAQIRWDDSESELIPFTTDIPLGSIPIDKTVRLDIWTQLGIIGSASLIHETGKQTVVLEEGPSYYVSLWYMLGGIFFGLFALSFIAILVENLSLKNQIATAHKTPGD